MIPIIYGPIYAVSQVHKFVWTVSRMILYVDVNFKWLFDLLLEKLYKKCIHIFVFIFWQKVERVRGHATILPSMISALYHRIM